jgi:hypothetical protein
MPIATLAPQASGITPLEAAALTDDALISRLGSLAEQRRRIDAASSILTAELDYRSRRELGYQGLAQKRGMRTTEALVQQVTGVSGADARTLVRVGTIIADATAPENPTPWLTECAAVIVDGTLSLHAADAIRSGLGSPSEAVPVAWLTSAVTVLLAEAGSTTPERLAVRARAMRDQLDEAGILDRELARRDRRFLNLTALPDGMTRLTGLLDPESAAIVVGAVDAITAPRRGGPRFVDPAEAARAAALDDGRTLPQLALDALVDLVRVATLADDRKLLGARRVPVRIHVSETDLARRAGAGYLEGQSDPVSLETVRRHLCESGAIELLFNSDGQPIDLGREERLYTPRQRQLLAARDGGCGWPSCDRPASWCEAHHIDEWARDGGKTDLADGVLLCRHHHMLVHNNGWRIARELATYWATPPDAGAERLRLEFNNRVKLDQKSG